MTGLRAFRHTALAVLGCLLVQGSSAQTSGQAGASPAPSIQVLQPEIKTGKVIATLPKAQDTDDQPSGLPNLDPLTKTMRVGCRDISLTVSESFPVEIGSRSRVDHRSLRISCGEVYERPVLNAGPFTFQPGVVGWYRYLYQPDDPAAQGLADMYLQMAQDAMRLDRTLGIDFVECDPRFKPSCPRTIVGLTLYKDRRTDAY